jgi:hypothetical protein
VRVISIVVFSLLLVSSRAWGQAVTVQGSAGPTITDAGYSVAAGIGISPISRFTMVFGVERTHLFSRFYNDGRGYSWGFRGGTYTLVSAEFRATILGRERVSPYAFGGIAGGMSRPNVNANFPNRVTNTAHALFIGGGIHVPVRDRISVFADVRMVFGAEGREGIVAYAPIRAGVAWRF